MDKLLDNIKKGVTIAVSEAEKLTKVVVDKTTNIVDITKLNLALNETEGKLNKLYAKIGEIVYTKYAEGAEFDGELGEICKEITSFKEEADKLKEQIAELKSSAVCANCGQHNDKESGFCSKCGAKLTGQEPCNTEDTVIEVTEFPEE
ncbi:MAG: hypothetical protein J6C82_00700 [Clostridia bacterium]|nr:hypothetical protein [Clostridia bacterium]